MKLMNKKTSGSFQVVSSRIKKNRTCEWTTLISFLGTTIKSSAMGAVDSFYTMSLILTVVGEGGGSVIFPWNNQPLFIHFGTSIKRSTVAPGVH
jgi:hypothetical protein